LLGPRLERWLAGIAKGAILKATTILGGGMGAIVGGLTLLIAECGLPGGGYGLIGGAAGGVLGGIVGVFAGRAVVRRGR
jgi:hypothetical protein